MQAVKLIDNALDLISNQTNSSNDQIKKSNNTQVAAAVVVNNDDIKMNNDVVSGGKLILKTAKGTIDYGPGDMVIRSRMMSSIKCNMYKFGGQFMETPVFELRDILMDKYGEDEKLIFDLAKQESEILSLRYDLTVPLARYVAQNRKNIKSPFKAARVGRVYRRDQPYMTRGRMREFWQCDFDIVRTSSPSNKLDLVLDDTEIITLCIKQLIDLKFGNFYVLINNRKLLSAILDICNVENNKIKLISSSIDKLDKKPWIEVKKEMIDRGLDDITAEKIKQFVEINGKPNIVLNKLKKNKYIIEYSKINKNVMEAILEFELLLKFVENYNPSYLDYLRIDMSMVRGLDYYTGIIMEAQFDDNNARINYGSIAGGGRFDKLVSDLLDRKKRDCTQVTQVTQQITTSNDKYPCVGFSVGFERIFCYLKEKQGIGSGVSTDILICELSVASNTSDGLGLYNERLKLLNYLRSINNININVEIMAKLYPSFRDQINYAEQREIKWMIIIGDDEIKNNTLNLRRLTLKNDIILTKDNKKGKIIDIKQTSTSKWPIFIVKSINQPNKNWKLNKKQISKVIDNNIEFDLQLTIKRDQLIPFFKKIYN